MWVNFEGSWNGRCGYILGHLVYFTANWYILLPFGIFNGYWVYFSLLWNVVPRKNLATLPTTRLWEG
jgi:hypothetical protein